MNRKAIMAIAAVTGMASCLFAADIARKVFFYCKYCGHKASSVASLTASPCIRHPNGPGKGKHALYEGSAKKSYTCKYCGKQSSDIMSLTASRCMRHPKGPTKGNHEPAL